MGLYPGVQISSSKIGLLTYKHTTMLGMGAASNALSGWWYRWCNVWEYYLFMPPVSLSESKRIAIQIPDALQVAWTYTQSKNICVTLFLFDSIYNIKYTRFLFFVFFLSTTRFLFIYLLLRFFLSPKYQRSSSSKVLFTI